MFSGPSRTPLFLSVLFLSGGLTGVRAQIHEEKPTPGLEVGVLAHWEKQGGHNQSPAGKTVGVGDFSVVWSVALPAELPSLSAPCAILVGSDEVASHDRKTGWRLMLGPDRSLSFTAQTKEGDSSVKISTLQNAVQPGRAHDIVVSVHRDARQPLSGIWVDGIELASGTFGPMDLRASLPAGNWDVSGWSKSVTVYDRALTRPEIVDLTLRRTDAAAPAAPAHPAPPANGPRFVPRENETIALIGGTEAVALAESGQLEAVLLMAFPQTRFHFRNLAWEGDTVFRQDRPMNFGSLEQQLRRINSSSVFVMFGRQECLDATQGTPVPGKAGLPEFKEAFEKILSTVEKVTPNIVVIAPPPFERKAPPLPDLSRANQEIMIRKQAMREISEKLGVVYAESFFQDDVVAQPATSDGVQFTPDGLRTMSDIIAASARFLDFSMLKTGNQRTLKPGEVDVIANQYDPTKKREDLCAELRSKNRLWHDYWRPSNWAFLYGDRTNQPSSRDPVNSQIRFFPAEQEKYLPLIKEAEEKVYRAVEETVKKLP